MIPNPSQPNRRKIRFGINTKRSIERTKARTRRVNRVIKGSEDI